MKPADANNPTRMVVGFQKLIGYIGAFLLLIGGISILFDIPYIGKLSCLYCPTAAGLIYMILAAAAIFFIFADKIKLLYLTGLGSLILLIFDLISSTKFSSTISNNISSNLSEYSVNYGFIISYTWIILILGIILMMLAPSINKENKKSVILNPREENYNERIIQYKKIKDEVMNLNNLDNNELTQLKQEYQEFREKK